MSTPTGPSALRFARWAVVLAVIAVAAGRFFDGFEADEVQHLHAAWLVGHGLVPYRDYFDHHMPLFHIVFGPMARAVGTNYVLLFVLARLSALAVACVSLALFGRLIPTAAGRVAVPLGVALLVVSRYVDFVFLLRPDFLAMCCLLLAAVLAIRASGPVLDGPLRHGLFVCSGLAAGVAFLFTQKSAAVLPAFGLWPLLGVGHSRGRSRLGWLGAASFELLGIALPIAALVGWLASTGALAGFLAGPIGFASHWTQKTSRFYILQEPFLLNLGIVGLGAAYALRATWKWLSRGEEIFRGDALLGMLVVFGIAGYLATPAPTQHAYVFTAAVWLVACCVRHVVALVTVPTLWADDRWAVRWPLAVGFALPLAVLRPYNIVLAAAAWMAVFFLWSRFGRMLRGERRVVWLYAVLGGIAAVGSLANIVERAVRHPFVAQLAEMRRIDSLIPEGSAALTAWPIFTCARPHATFHWFSDNGMYSSTPPGMYTSEYMAALDNARTAVVVCHPAELDRYVPEVMARVRREFVEDPLPPEAVKPMYGARVFVRTPAARHHD